MDMITPELAEAVLSLSAVVATGIVGWVAQRVEKRWGYDMDARARETLHSALVTGAQMAWARVDDNSEPPHIADMIKIVTDHVLGAGAKDAVARLNASPTALQNLAEAKLAEVGVQFARSMLVKR